MPTCSVGFEARYFQFLVFQLDGASLTIRLVTTAQFFSYNSRVLLFWTALADGAGALRGSELVFLALQPLHAIRNMFKSAKMASLNQFFELPDDDLDLRSLLFKLPPLEIARRTIAA